MFLPKMVVKLFLLFTLCLSSSILYADSIPITEIEEVVEHVKTLRRKGIKPESIGVILDCHGVVTEEIGHSTSHTLKGNIREALTYFKEEGICVVIATAWDKLDEVVEHAIVATGLGHFFGVEPGRETKLEDFAVGPEGSVKLKGHRNGKVVALKNADDFADPTYLANYPYFRQKAFALEVAYPGQVLTDISGTDDDEYNLKIFKRNFPRTRHYSEECNLTLFHLKSPKVTVSLESGLSFCPPPLQPLSTVRLYPPSSQSSSYQTPPLRTVIPYHVPTPPSSTCIPFIFRSNSSTQPTPFHVPSPPPSITVEYNEEETYSGNESPRGDNFYDGYGDDPDNE
ncbi:MAG: hypothetical protein KBD36_04080 [Alphaproteobacteria bacterium]|nr:hypothetical protein [Alphaproteobacteria bacterium]MBP9777001.1 hypothetical protein [Alphaproteobacteria bacterium]